MVIDRLQVVRPSKTVIDGLSLRLPARGALCLMGPGGAGKSTLLSVLGVSADPSEVKVSGRVLLDDAPLSGQRESIGYYPQWRDVTGDMPSSARATRLTDTQKRERSQLRLRQLEAFLARPRRMYVLDEPTVHMNDDDAETARALLAAAAGGALLVMCTHNRRDALALDGETAIFADGRIVEMGPSRDVLVNPQTDGGKQYVETGHLAVAPAPQASGLVNGIWAAVPNLLYGMSRPGLTADAQVQYRQLAESGVRQLVCLEERTHTAAGDSLEHGIVRHHFAINDMAPPSFNQAVDICRLAEESINRNEAVAFHCRGGLGRTGTAIGAVLVWYGESPQAAIERVRLGHPRAIQTQSQVSFLHDFAERIRDWRKPETLT